jgi:hypothetical protein
VLVLDIMPPHLPSHSKERKELDKVRKARRNKNFGLIEEAKVLWEEARRSDISPEKRSKLITAILGKVQGRLAELAGSHSASRIIQSCAKYGSPAGWSGMGIFIVFLRPLSVLALSCRCFGSLWNAGHQPAVAHAYIVEQAANLLLPCFVLQSGRQL